MIRAVALGTLLSFVITTAAWATPRECSASAPTTLRPRRAGAEEIRAALEESGPSRSAAGLEEISAADVEQALETLTQVMNGTVSVPGVAPEHIWRLGWSGDPSRRLEFNVLTVVTVGPPDPDRPGHNEAEVRVVVPGVDVPPAFAPAMKAAGLYDISMPPDVLSDPACHKPIRYTLLHLGRVDGAIRREEAQQRAAAQQHAAANLGNPERPVAFKDGKDGADDGLIVLPGRLTIPGASGGWRIETSGTYTLPENTVVLTRADVEAPSPELVVAPGPAAPALNLEVIDQVVRQAQKILETAGVTIVLGQSVKADVRKATQILHDRGFERLVVLPTAGAERSKLVKDLAETKPLPRVFLYAADDDLTANGFADALRAKTIEVPQHDQSAIVLSLDVQPFFSTLFKDSLKMSEEVLTEEFWATLHAAASLSAAGAEEARAVVPDLIAPVVEKAQASQNTTVTIFLPTAPRTLRDAVKILVDRGLDQRLIILPMADEPWAVVRERLLGMNPQPMIYVCGTREDEEFQTRVASLGLRIIGPSLPGTTDDRIYLSHLLQSSFDIPPEKLTPAVLDQLFATHTGLEQAA